MSRNYWSDSCPFENYLMFLKQAYLSSKLCFSGKYFVLRRLKRVFKLRGGGGGEIGSELMQSQSQCRAKSNEPEMKGASLLSIIYLKNLLSDLC